MTQSYRGLKASQLPFLMSEMVIGIFYFKIPERGRGIVKIYRIVLTVVAFCLLCTSVVTLSMGWLTNVWSAMEGDQKIPFSAGKAQEYELFRISYSNENKQKVLPVKNLGLSSEEHTTLFSKTNTIEIDAELEFGNINNLYFLENENYIFYAVKIPVEMGKNVELGIFNTDIDSDGYHFSIWEIKTATDTETGTTTETLVKVPKEVVVNDQLVKIWDNVAGIEVPCTKNDSPDGQTFIQYSFALSNQAPEKLTDIGLMFSLFGQDYPLNNFDANDGDKPKCFTQKFTGEPTSDGFYYLYIRLEPNMPLYKNFIEHLYAYMPFYLSYETRIILSVTPANES